jgi:Icc-related predicted phosphoesterase
MKLLLISDTHGLHENITKDLNKLIEPDTIIIHAGDISNTGKSNEITSFLNWFSNLECKHKIFIAGNHDFGFEPTISAFPPIYPDIPQEFKDKGVIYLMDQMVEVEGLKIYGTPWQPRFHDWAFNVNRGEELAKKWEPIPEGLDILISHGPPYSILDCTREGLHVGCEDLYIKIINVLPKMVVFGHIHEGYGYRSTNNISFFNASVLNRNYNYTNKPILVTLDDNNNIIDIKND